MQHYCRVCLFFYVHLCDLLVISAAACAALCCVAQEAEEEVEKLEHEDVRLNPKIQRCAVSHVCAGCCFFVALLPGFACASFAAGHPQWQY